MDIVNGAGLFAASRRVGDSHGTWTVVVYLFALNSPSAYQYQPTRTGVSGEERPYRVSAAIHLDLDNLSTILPTRRGNP